MEDHPFLLEKWESRGGWPEPQRCTLPTQEGKGPRSPPSAVCYGTSQKPTVDFQRSPFRPRLNRFTGNPVPARGLTARSLSTQLNCPHQAMGYHPLQPPLILPFTFRLASAGSPPRGRLSGEPSGHPSPACSSGLPLVLLLLPFPVTSPAFTYLCSSPLIFRNSSLYTGR